MSKEPGQLAYETFFRAKNLWNSAPGPHKELWAHVEAAVGADSDARATAAEARVRELEAQLGLYRDAVRIDAKMSGPQFMGANTSALKRAWEADCARALLEDGAQKNPPAD